MRDLWRVECPDGMFTSARVTLNGEPVTTVTDVSISLGAGGVVQATFTVENVEVDIGALPDRPLPLGGPPPGFRVERS